MDWNGIDIIEGIKNGFERSMSNLFQVNDENTSFDYVMRVGFVLELGLLFLALRRKLERRFRH